MSNAKPLPSNLKQGLLDAMSVAETSIEGAEYLVTRFKELLTAAKMQDKYGDILQKVEDFSKYTKFKLLSSSQPWLGQSNPSSDFKNMQNQIALDAARNLKDMNIGPQQKVTFDFAVSDKSEFLRGYSKDGTAMDLKAVDSMDKLFNAFLAENNVVSEGSIFYEATDQGKIKQDAQGKKMVAEAEKVTDLITNSEKGFKQYLNKNSPGIDFTCQPPQQYPSTEKVAEVKTSIEETIKAAPNEEPTVPSSSGMGSSSGA